MEVFKCEESVNLAHYFPYDVKLRLLPHSRSFLANQKARNAIVGAENLLILDGNTEIAQAVDVMMARAKRIYILIIKVNKLFSCFSLQCFSKRNRITCSPCFYRAIETFVKVWANSKKLWKHSPAARVPTAF